jgi:hypothetical protein
LRPSVAVNQKEDKPKQKKKRRIKATLTTTRAEIRDTGKYIQQ